MAREDYRHARELPFDPRFHVDGDDEQVDNYWASEHETVVGGASHRPMTPMEALMSTAPGDEPETSKLELLAIRELLADAIDDLTDMERWVFEQVVIAKRSVRALGLPKTTVTRIRDRAISKLRESLKDSPLIIEYLEKQ